MRKAEESILAKAELEIAPFQKQIDALNKKNQDLADKAALAGDSLAKLQADADKLKANIDNLNAALSKILINRILDPNYAGSQTERDDVAAYRRAAGDAGILGTPKKRTAPAKSPDEARSQYQSDQASIYGEADKLLGSLAKSIEKNGIVANNVSVYAKEIKTDNSKLTPTVTSGTTPKTGTFGAPKPQSVTQAKDVYDAAQKSRTQGSTQQYYDGYNYWYLFDYKGRTYATNDAGTDVRDYSPTGGVSRNRVKKAKYGVVGGKGSVIAGEFGMPEIVDFENRTILPAGVTNSFIQGLDNASPRYNIPTNSITGVNGSANNSYNNNTYNIDIQLSGTSVTADDIIRKFKAELALINAKEGRARTIGGQY
jgi:hypothetical protein